MGSSECELVVAGTRHDQLTQIRGAFATFATEGTGFSGYFPGIKPHLLTLGTCHGFD